MTIYAKQFIPMTVIQVSSGASRSIWTWVTSWLNVPYPHRSSTGSLFPKSQGPPFSPHPPSPPLSFLECPPGCFLLSCSPLPLACPMCPSLTCNLALSPLSPFLNYVPFAFPARKLPNSKSECIWILFPEIFFNSSNFGPKEILGCNTNKRHLPVEFHRDVVSGTLDSSRESCRHCNVSMLKPEPFFPQTPACPSLM